MTQRKLTLKSFVKKASSAKSAIAFLQSHREFLTTGEVASLTSTIVAKIDNGVILPTPGLEEITNAVFAHMMVQLQEAAEEAIIKNNSSQTSKPITARILTSNGEEITASSFNLHQDAERWCDNRLYAGTPGSYGEIVHNKIMIKGKPDTSIVTREDSIARILKQPRGAMTKRVGVAAGKLGFGIKAKQSHAHFSRG
jgi:hypothetical protein